MRCHSGLLVVLPWSVLVAGCSDPAGPQLVTDSPATGITGGAATVAPTASIPAASNPSVGPAGASDGNSATSVPTSAATTPASGASNPSTSTGTNVDPGPVDGAGLGGVNVDDDPPPAASPSTPAVSPSTPAVDPTTGAGDNDATDPDDVAPAPTTMPVFPQPSNPGGFPPPGDMGGAGGMGGDNTDGTPSGDTTNDSSDDGPVDVGDNGPVDLDCDATMPTSGEQQHSGNGTGGDGNLAWEIWSNTGQGELTTYDVPAFSAIWNEAGGYLGRLGYEWGGFGETPVPYEQLGTITAQFVSNRSGTAGGYSYIGMYGWSTDPCVEWYVVEDSYNGLPFNPGMTTNMGEVQIDGGTYIMYTRPTTGTGGTRCSGVNEWMQFYSMRTEGRRCGEISLTEHFDAWKSLGMEMGNLLEAKILVEVGGGTGRVDLPIANVMVTP